MGCRSVLQYKNEKTKREIYVVKNQEEALLGKPAIKALKIILLRTEEVSSRDLWGAT